MGEQPKGYLVQPDGFETKAIHSGHSLKNSAYGAIVTPVVMSSIYRLEEPDSFPNPDEGYFYSRLANPTRDVLQNAIAALDGGRYGFAFASGMGAITTITALLSAGDHIICADDIYGGTNTFMRKIVKRMGLEVDFVDIVDLAAVEKLFKKNTRMVWFESPSNPTMVIADIKALSTLVHKQDNVLLVVDNTFLSPYYQRPLELGVDIVMYSLTKYMNGHSDVVMGGAVTDREDLKKRLEFLLLAMGVVPSPSDCAMVTRGLKTLALRMEKHGSNSLALAKYLEQHPKISKVIHPSLPTHPQHKLALSQSYGHSGVFSFYLKGGLEESKKFLKGLKLIIGTASLGGVESTIELPSRVSHKFFPEAQRIRLGITDNLVRISVGLESISDIIADIEQALK